MRNSNPLSVIKNMYPSFHRVEKQLADFILNDPEIFITLSVSRIAERTRTACSSVIRFCKTIGYSGLKELKIKIAKNIDLDQDAIFEAITPSDQVDKILPKVFDASINALQDTLKSIDKASFAKAVSLLAKAKRIEFYGVGTSATLAVDAYYRFMRIGFPAFVATDPHISRISASKLNANSVAVGISHTGRTKDTCDTLKIAKKQGAKIISITSFRKNAITKISDVELIVSSTETRVMKEAVSSRIAQIAVIDSLYVAVALRKYSNTTHNIDAITEIYKDLRY